MVCIRTMIQILCHNSVSRIPDQDQTFHFDTDPDPTFHFDVYPDPDSEKDPSTLISYANLGPLATDPPGSSVSLHAFIVNTLGPPWLHFKSS
jgi:hypothetical protein